MFSFYKKIICVDKSLRFLHHVWVRKCFSHIYHVFHISIDDKSIVAVDFLFWRNGTAHGPKDYAIISTQDTRRTPGKCSLLWSIFQWYAYKYVTMLQTPWRNDTKGRLIPGSFLPHSQPYKETLEHSAFRIWGISWMKLHLGRSEEHTSELQSPC